LPRRRSPARRPGASLTRRGRHRRGATVAHDRVRELSHRRAPALASASSAARQTARPQLGPTAVLEAPGWSLRGFVTAARA
jgi:hypothetical protein